MTHPLEQINFTQTNQAVVIEASAGTGKTWTIERLYIKALIEGSLIGEDNLPLAVENILVVTFTNDATDELKQRISEQIKSTINLLTYLRNNSLPIQFADDLFIGYLVQRIELGEIEKDITLLVRALQNFDSSAIFTIHGFCNRVLQDYQFECRSSAVFDLIVSRQTLIGKLVRDFFRKFIFNNRELVDNIAEILVNLRKMFDPKNDRFDVHIIDLVVAKLPNDLFKIISGDYLPKYTIPIESSLDALVDMSIQGNKELLTQVKAQFLAKVIEYIQLNYAAEVAQSSSISYDELIQIVADSLVNFNKLADTLFTKYPVAFIDEFQDTDNLQWQIFSMIYDLDKETKRGNVIVVGDPKQAIYSFRGADIETYLVARNAIANKLELTQNFRSNPAIMDFINQLFALPNQNTSLKNSFLGSQIDYVCVEAMGGSDLRLPDKDALQNMVSSHGINQVFYDESVHLVAVVGKAADERKDKLLSAMTFEILALLNVDASLKGKIAILVEKNAQAKEIVNFLAKYGVKATELKLGNIFASSTANSLYKILLACSDLALRKNFMLALANSLFNLPFNQLQIDNNQTNSMIEFWYQKFFSYKQIWQQNSVISLVYRLLEDIVLWHKQNSTQLSPVFTNRELANLYQLAELLNKQSAKLQNQAELMFWFHEKITNANQQLVEDIDGNNEELVRLDNDDEQIIITTQHKSKGLEYEVLFCPYFKSTIKLDGEYDYNYKRPFFNSYRDNGHKHSQMIMDEVIAHQVVEQANQETNRLNYVALTRAKARIYIYLQHITLSSNKYHAASRPSKVYDLFGFNVHDNSDTTHPLFNYPEFFSDNPMNAFKRPQQFNGVVAYRRDKIVISDLTKLQLNNSKIKFASAQVNYLERDLANIQILARQSYSGITHSGNNDVSDWYLKNEVLAENIIEYKYQVLNDEKLKGATFGTLFHGLCEEYPFTTEQLTEHLIKNNVAVENNDYVNEFMQMLDLTFNYPLIKDMTLNTLANKLHELEFNLTIVNHVDLGAKLSQLLGKHFGEQHRFTAASKTLGEIKQGFLIGFIDLFFELDGKYWVLDYKTNKLNDYQSAHLQSSNEIIDSMSEHHYYLQYLLYLVAIKRYLEFALGVEDASSLIGGAVYFYVRGAFTTVQQLYDGVFIDDKCQLIIKELDELLQGCSYAK